VKRSFAAALAFSVAALASPGARAEIDLQWTAPPNCPQGDEVRQRLRSLAGPSLDRVELRTEATIEQADDGHYRLRLRVLDDEVRERVIESDSCSDLAGAAAVALVFLLQEVDDSSAGSQSETPAESAEPNTPDSTAGSPQGPADFPASEKDRAPGDDDLGRGASRSTLLLQLPIVTLDLGALPKASIGFGLGAGVRHQAWSLVVRGALGLPQHVSAQVPEVGALLQPSSASALGCRGWSWGRVELSPCVLLMVEHIAARGTGSELEARSASSTWLAPGAELSLHVSLDDWLALFLGLSGRVETAPPRIFVDRIGDVQRLGPLALGTVLGAEWIP
jgi:hypothetical protein